MDPLFAMGGTVPLSVPGSKLPGPEAKKVVVVALANRGTPGNRRPLEDRSVPCQRGCSRCASPSDILPGPDRRRSIEDSRDAREEALWLYAAAFLSLRSRRPRIPSA